MFVAMSRGTWKEKVIAKSLSYRHVADSDAPKSNIVSLTTRSSISWSIIDPSHVCMPHSSIRSFLAILISLLISVCSLVYRRCDVHDKMNEKMKRKTNVKNWRWIGVERKCWKNKSQTSVAVDCMKIKLKTKLRKSLHSVVIETKRR